MSPEERELENLLLRKLDELQREYKAKAEPYVQQLVKLRAMRPPPPFVLLAADLK